MYPPQPQGPYVPPSQDPYDSPYGNQWTPPPYYGPVNQGYPPIPPVKVSKYKNVGKSSLIAAIITLVFSIVFTIAEIYFILTSKTDVTSFFFYVFYLVYFSHSSSIEITIFVGLMISLIYLICYASAKTLKHKGLKIVTIIFSAIAIPIPIIGIIAGILGIVYGNKESTEFKKLHPENNYVKPQV